MNRTIALAAALLAGCATSGAEMDAARNSWLGARYDDVVLSWGAPMRSTPLSDRRLAYTWVSDRASSGGTIFPSVGIFGGSGGVGVGVGVGGAMGGGGEFVRCERTLVFRDASVVEQTWYGPTGYCSTFRRR